MAAGSRLEAHEKRLNPRTIMVDQSRGPASRRMGLPIVASGGHRAQTGAAGAALRLHVTLGSSHCASISAAVCG